MDQDAHLSTPEPMHPCIGSGVPGCASKYPGAYARVQNYLSWIKEITKDGDCSSGSSSATTASKPATTAAPRTTTKKAASTTTSDDYSYGGNYNNNNIDYNNYIY